MKVFSFTHIDRGPLLGFADVELDGTPKLRLHGLSIFAKDGKRWANPPGRPKLDRHHAVVRDRDGRVQYEPVVTFADKSQRDAFSTSVIDALIATGHLPPGGGA